MMKNYLFSTLVIFIVGNLCHFGLPWWSVAPIAAIVFIIWPKTGPIAFAAGVTAGTLLWTVSAVWLNVANGSVFSAKIGQVFQGLSTANLLYITGLIGGLLGGFGALTGQMARDMFSTPKQRDYYVKRGKSGRYR